MKIVGATLIELMIALVVGLLLVTAMLQAYLNSQGKILLANNILQIEDAALNSMTVFSQEIQRAGYIGCARLSEHFPIYSSGYLFSNENKLTFSKDVLVSRHAAFDPAFLLQPSTGGVLLTTDNHHFQTENVLIISDCRHAEIFVVKRVYHGHQVQKIEPKKALHSVFDKNAEIALFEINKLFIKATPQRGNVKSENKTLYLEDIQKSIKPLQEGVNSFYFKPYYQKNVLNALVFIVNFRLEKTKKIWSGYAKIG